MQHTLTNREGAVDNAIITLGSARAALAVAEAAYLADPFNEERIDRYDEATVHLQLALFRLARNQRRLRLACPGCLMATEHDLDAQGCEEHLTYLGDG